MSYFMYYFHNSVKRKVTQPFPFKTHRSFCSRRFQQERVTSSSSVMDRASSAHLYLFTRFSRKNMGDRGGWMRGGSTLQCEVCTGTGSRYFCRRAAGWGGMYDVHRILAAGYIGAD